MDSYMLGDEEGSAGGIPNYNNISGVFKCFQCDYKCSTAISLKMHYQIHRSQDPYKCFQCGYEGTDAEDFKCHSIKHFEESYYKCPKCNYKAEHRQSITNHVRYVHKQICFCGEQFKVKNKFMAHLIDHPDCKENVELDPESVAKLENFARRYVRGVSSCAVRKPAKKFRADSTETRNVSWQQESNNMHVCQICFFVFKTAEALREHTASVHLGPNLSCDRCDFSCESENELNKHALTHIDKLFLCRECNFVFSSKASLKKHAETHSIDVNGVDYVCYICDKSFSSERSVKLHMNHHNLVKHQCPICSVVLKSMAGLKNHMHMHDSKSPKKTLSCHKCDKVCATEVGLKQHLATHTTKGFHWCPFCNFKTKTRAELRKHFRSLNHLKGVKDDEFVEEFICCKCSYETTTEEELQGHWFEEHNEGNLDCSECMESFETTEELKEHLSVHFKPYTCEECEESFCTRNILNKHSFIHRPEIALECPICDRNDFDNLQQLKDHAIDHHNEARAVKPSPVAQKRQKSPKKSTFKVKFSKN